MKYRNCEGQGECMYVIGLEDNGNPLGLKKKKMYESISTLCLMAK